MPDLENWDDLLHGTVVFGAALPFAVALAVGLLQPSRLWMAVGLGLAGPFLWCFGVPSLPFGSDDALVLALGAGLILVALDVGLRPPLAVKVAAGTALWALLAWLLYPAWLAAEGGTARRLLVTGALAVSVTVFGTAMGRLAKGGRPLSSAAGLPLAVGLAVLLATGGASQFAQCAGAVAAVSGALCVVNLRNPEASDARHALTLCAMLLAVLAWSGWLFAEIRPGAAVLLFVSPFVALAARFLPLPRQRPILVPLWDGVAAAIAVAPVLIVVILEYTASGAGDYEGY